MIGRNISFALILILVSAVALSGCSGPSTPVTVTPGATDSAMLAAHDAYTEARNVTTQYHDELGQLDTRMQNINYSDPGAIVAVANMTGELDGYISSLRQADTAAGQYRSYLSSNSDEYKQLVDYDVNLNSSIQSAQAIRSTLSDYHDMLGLYTAWQQSGDSLQIKFATQTQPRYGDDMRKWLLEIRPQIVDFISDGTQASSSIDTSMYETTAGPGRVSMTLMKKEISDRNDSYKDRFNALVSQYNSTFGQAFGSVPAI
jgi:hypothetical protein